MKKVVLKLIRIYQKSKFVRSAFFRNLYITDAVCRFRPTCSEYTYQAIKKYGVATGSLIGIKRVIRCHPWNKGGYDPLE